MNATKPMPAGALYYPYIHIKNLNWLKANLIIFPCVKRMVPENFMPRDDEAIRPFTLPWGERDALLRSANLFSSRSTEAQTILANKLKESSAKENFLTRYGQDAARRVLSADDYGFQIHVRKLSPELSTVLSDMKLSWDPYKREPYDEDSGYIEVHPRVGEAVMSTLAVACALSEGLDIVGDERSGALRRCLLQKDLASIYDAWLSTENHSNPPDNPSGEELMDFMLGITADLWGLSVADLHEITTEREPIDNLVEALRQHAAKIPAMDEGPNRDEVFKQVAQEVMEKWREDRDNLSGFAKKFFSVDAAKPVLDFAGKVAEKALGPAVGGAISGGWHGSLSEGALIGAGAGLVFGLVTHGWTSYKTATDMTTRSPYKFLTTLEDAGVVFQSEAIA